MEGELTTTKPDGTTDVWIPSNIHFHAPSEHTINGKQYDVEMHIVHINKATRALGTVVGILFDVEKGGPSPFLETLSVEFATNLNKFTIVDEELQNSFYRVEQPVAIERLLKSIDTEKFYHYEGSLTTPPCTEGLNWFVLHETQPISKEQVEAFTTMWAGNPEFSQGHGNFRVTQPLNGRTVYRPSTHTNSSQWWEISQLRWLQINLDNDFDKSE